MKRTWFALAVMLAASWGCDIEADDEISAAAEVDAEQLGEVSQASSTNVVATVDTARLVRAKNELYWSSNSIGPSNTARIYKTLFSGTPGSEMSLYSETSIGVRFGALAVNIDPLTLSGYVYFLALYPGVAQIKRVATSGGAATTLTTLVGSVTGDGDLRLDGTSLFWSDSTGIYKMAIGGGSQVLITAQPGLHLALDTSNVFYNVGGDIRSVAKTGLVAPVSHYNTPQVVKALGVRSGSPSIIYWGDDIARVLSMPAGGGTVSTYRSGTLGRYVTSVGFDGTRAAWTDCDNVVLNDCKVGWDEPFGPPPTYVATGLRGADNMSSDATRFFYATDPNTPAPAQVVQYIY